MRFFLLLCLVGAFCLQWRFLSMPDGRGSRLRWLLPGLTALCWVLVAAGLFFPGSLPLMVFLTLGGLSLVLLAGWSAAWGLRVLSRRWSPPGGPEAQWAPSALLRGSMAASLWLAGFFAAFPVWRYAAFFGVLPLALAVGGLNGALLGVRSGRACVLGLAAASILSLLLLPVLWNTPWFERMLLALYEGFHVTESGFAGLFTIAVYLPVSALTTLAAAVVLLERRLKKSGA